DQHRVDAIVIHWNQGRACEETVSRLDQEPLVESITVVDNGSRSEERHLVENALAATTTNSQLIALGENRGFGPATNEGWKRWLNDVDGSEFSLVLPHDAYAEPGALEQMLAAAISNPRLGLLSADVGDGMVPVVDKNLGPIFKPGGSMPGVELCDYPHGTMFIARRACLSETGLFDERFFTYCEEADLGLRAGAAGWEVGLARGARVINPRVSTPLAAADYLMQRNTLLLTAKHFGAWATVVRSVVAIGQLIDRTVRRSRRDEYFSVRARLMALRDAALRRFGPPPPSLLQ
ncbi:MAG: glycosyltransferase, partial [Acidimicrobiia bacterium]|nr:glycosyltransferase [Acidimicrobiia bacterium]